MALRPLEAFLLCGVSGVLSFLLTTFTQVVLRFPGEDIRALPVKRMIPVVCLFLNFVCLL